MSRWLLALLLATRADGHIASALRSVYLLAGPRCRHIASRPVLGRAHSAAVLYASGPTRTHIGPVPPFGQLAAALWQPRGRIARWVVHAARWVLCSFTLTFARVAHASSDGARSKMGGKLASSMMSLWGWAAFAALVGAMATSFITEVGLLDYPIFAMFMTRSTVDPPKEAWTPRETAEMHIQDYLRNPRKKVLIIVGPRASGKSTIARHALRDVSGAAFVDPTGQDGLRKQLLVAVGMPFAGRFTNIGRPALVRMFEFAIWWKRRKGDKKWMPTILVDMNKESNAKEIKDALVTLKILAHDGRACKAILVLSDANAALGIDEDEARHNYLWLGDYSREEASAYFDSEKVLVGKDALRDEVYGVTTRPGVLFDLATMLLDAPGTPSEPIVRAFIKAKHARAENRVANLLSLDVKQRPELGLHFRRLLTDMVANGGTLSAKDASKYMRMAIEVSPSIKQCHAIAFDITACEYRFNTPADMTAAARLC